MASDVASVVICKCRTFSAKEVEEATNNYHVSRIIGEVGSTTVFKGLRPDKTVVVVKKYRISGSIFDNPYAVNEAGVASQTNHINLVRFLGCFEAQTPALSVVSNFKSKLFTRETQITLPRSL
ncbi:unnamed protein product [Prunus armeniaca]|uniref:Protein kinase domain-containing protein n=1 Tax=Prunus armeniaca TaxID=36596 RepID=A0A6J5WM14_PRUAR|nr:unnamed protein product [Prunus armeniaca]